MIFEFSLAITVFILAIIFIIKRRAICLGLCVLFYAIPFLSLFSQLWGGEVHFWSIGFSYEPNFYVVKEVNRLLLLSGLGFLFSLAFVKEVGLTERKIEEPFLQFSEGFIRSTLFFIYIIALLIVLISASKELHLTNGGELIVSNLLVVAYFLTKFQNNMYLKVINWILISFFVFYQITNGDREFVTIFVGMFVIWALRNGQKFSVKNLCFWFLLFLIILFFGVLVSLSRQDLILDQHNFIEYLRFNSWNATILPVIKAIESPHQLLLGQSYLDLVLSFLPSVVYSWIDLVKPITINNPANWYFVKGLGGFHIVGIGYLNFGLLGVFFQAFILGSLLLKMEMNFYRYANFWNYLLCVLLAAALMHGIWYGAIYLVNALTFFALVFLMINIKKLFNNLPTKSD